MSISISGSNAISGLSGMDTDFDVALEKLYAIEKTQLNQLEAWKSDWQLRYDAFNDVIDQMSAAKQMLSNIGSVNNFVTKNAVSTDESVLTAIATGAAANGQHKITVDRMASNAIWCNTGAVFQEKSDIINTTGHTVTFSFEYAGKNYSYDIAANTTLESFVSLINNSSANPGITVSLLNTGNGYVYQIAGKKTGEANSLTVFSCELEGMNAQGSTSVWATDSPIDMNNANVTNPTQYVYTVTLDTGSTINVNISGDATNEELASKLSNAVGTGLITASVDPATQQMVLGGVSSIQRGAKDDSAYVPGGYRIDAGTALSTSMLGESSTEQLTVTVTLQDGNTRVFSIEGKASKQDFLNQIKQSLNSSAGLGMDEHGSYAMSLANVAAINIENSSNTTYTLDQLGFTGGSTYEAKGSQDLTTTLSQSSLKLTFAEDKLSKRLDGKESGDGEALAYTIVLRDGSAIYVDKTADGTALTGDLTNEALRDAIKAQMGTSNYTETNVNEFTLANVQAIYLSTGKAAGAGFSSKLTAETILEPQTDGTNVLTTLEVAPDLTYSFTLNSGYSETFTMASGSSMREIMAEMSSRLAAQNSELSLVDEAGNSYSVVTSGSTISIVDENGHEWSSSDGQLTLQITDALSIGGTGLSGQVVKSSNWGITNASNAVYQVDNWPMPMESQSNEITDLLDGVALTLQGVGTANLTVSTDIQSVETSIQNFLDAVNSVLMTIRDLTKVDEDKAVTSNDPDDVGTSNYSKSTLTSEKGGLLTGNYGVQLVKSRFVSCVTGTPPGFQAMATADDMLSGDILSNLANMGIKTDTDSTSQTYGLLVIAPNSDILRNMDAENYQDMINNHINELVDFFVSSGKGVSTSSDFRYSSHIDGITEAGTYDVSYTVGSDGSISDVTIGGEPCGRDDTKGGYYFTCRSGAARGLAISIDDLTEGTHNGTVRIKQGLVQTVESFLSKELTYNDVNITPNANSEVISAQISLKSQNGAMMTLKANYAKIMENIDNTIDKEQRRLDNWYTHQKNIFANLETLLSQYNEQQTQLESQLAQLSSNKS